MINIIRSRKTLTEKEKILNFNINHSTFNYNHIHDGLHVEPRPLTEMLSGYFCSESNITVNAIALFKTFSLSKSRL